MERVLDIGRCVPFAYLSCILDPRRSRKERKPFSPTTTRDMGRGQVDRSPRSLECRPDCSVAVSVVLQTTGILLSLQQFNILLALKLHTITFSQNCITKYYVYFQD